MLPPAALSDGFPHLRTLRFPRLALDKKVIPGLTFVLSTPPAPFDGSFWILSHKCLPVAAYLERSWHYCPRGPFVRGGALFGASLILSGHVPSPRVYVLGDPLGDLTSVACLVTCARFVPRRYLLATTSDLLSTAILAHSSAASLTSQASRYRAWHGAELVACHE